MSVRRSVTFVTAIAIVLLGLAVASEPRGLAVDTQAATNTRYGSVALRPVTAITQTSASYGCDLTVAKNRTLYQTFVTYLVSDPSRVTDTATPVKYTAGSYVRSYTVTGLTPGATYAVRCQASTTALGSPIISTANVPYTTQAVTTTSTTTTTTEPPVTTEPPTTTTPPPPASLPMLGATTADNTSWNTFDAQVGPMIVRRTFEGPNSGSTDASSIPPSFAVSRAGTGGDVAAGRLSAVSMKPPPAAFAAGTYDARFLAYLNSIPAGHRFVGTIYHEPEDEITSGVFTAADWIAANAHAGALVDSLNRPELAWEVIYRGPYTISAYGGFEKYWSDTAFAGTVIDYIGLDPYLNKTSMCDYLATSFAWVNSKGKPITIPEYGQGAYTQTAYPRNRVEWLQDAWACFKATHVVFAAYFNYTGGAGSTVLTTPEELAEFRAEVAESRAGQ